jgi:type IV pilus assembly protein PilP
MIPSLAEVSPLRSLTLVVLLSAVSFAAEPRDPFAPFSEKTPVVDTCKQSLCKSGLDELKLVALVTGSASPLAMFETRSGTGLTAKLHQEIGTGGGHVTSITSECVTITTFNAMADGRRLAQDIKVCLSHDAPTEHELLSDTEVVVP